MCGITGYIGYRDSISVLLNGLRRLEYRGYDSAGIALLNEKDLICIKKAGKVSDLQTLIDDSILKGKIREDRLNSEVKVKKSLSVTEYSGDQVRILD